MTHLSVSEQQELLRINARAVDELNKLRTRCERLERENAAIQNNADHAMKLKRNADRENSETKAVVAGLEATILELERRLSGWVDGLQSARELYRQKSGHADSFATDPQGWWQSPEDNHVVLWLLEWTEELQAEEYDRLRARLAAPAVSEKVGTICDSGLCREMNAEQEPLNCDRCHDKGTLDAYGQIPCPKCTVPSESIACDKQSASNSASNSEPKCEVCGGSGVVERQTITVIPGEVARFAGNMPRVPCPECGGGR